MKKPKVKKAKSDKRKPARRIKAKGRPGTVEDYLARVPEPARGTLNKVRAAIRSAVPSGAAEIISYGIPAFRHKQVLVWYAAFSKHCSLFPTKAAMEACKGELKSYRLSKGTIQFPTDKPLPALLVKKLVKARLAQIASS